MSFVAQWSIKVSAVLTGVLIISLSQGYPQQRIDLTLDTVVEIMMSNSYSIARLKMGIEQSRYRLKAERAGLKSSVYMNFETPDLNRTSDNKWNSQLGRNEIVRENSSRWQMDLRINQPVILFGYPTNGNISVNYKMYRYGQSESGDTFTDYYNRLYLQFEQPLFQPNRLKNEIEEAELNLEDEELDYLRDQVRRINDISRDYNRLFSNAYKTVIINNYLNNLQQIFEIASEIAQRDSTRQIEHMQIELALANAQNDLIGNQSEIRGAKARMIQRLRLNDDVVLDIDPIIDINPITVDQDQALQYAYSLRPNMRMNAINMRKEEIDFEYTKADNALRLDLVMTYGLERKDERYQCIWNDYDNSNSVTLNAYVPIWDWGQRKARIEAGRIALDRIDLSTEETRQSIRTEVMNSIFNLNENQTRALSMKESVELAKDITDTSINQYKNNEISLQDLLQTVSRQKETEENLLNAYLEYRYAIQNLKISTYYDYEKNITLIDELTAINE